MRQWFLQLVIVFLLVATRIGAQQTGATIMGVVRDTALRPIAGATITILPGARKTETDSAGRFQVTGLGADGYTVRARKIGYRPDSWDVKLSKNGNADVKFELVATPQILDTIRVRADGSCPTTRNIESFLCRRKRPGGLFLDFNDIDERDKGFVGELFWDIPGFRVDFRVESGGPAYIVRTQRLSGCINSLVDGRPVTGANRIPITTSTLIALEVYVRPDSVPKELQMYTWPDRGNITRSGRCAVIVYWTSRAPFELTRTP